jgi:two-component system, OmpR family, phosphate regulon response regulator PhoB
VEVDTRTIDVHINRLRTRLEASGADTRIETLRGVGYRLVAADADQYDSRST